MYAEPRDIERATLLFCKTVELTDPEHCTKTDKHVASSTPLCSHNQHSFCLRVLLTTAANGGYPLGPQGGVQGLGQVMHWLCLIPGRKASNCVEAVTL